MEMPEEPTLRLLVYLDAPFRIADTPTGPRIATHPMDYTFVGVFLAEVARHFRSTLLLGRLEDTKRLGDFVPLPSHLELAPLPFYSSLADFGAVARAAPRTVTSFWRALDQADVVWISGPHPFGLILAAQAAARRTPFLLGIRQDVTRYFPARLRSRRSRPVLLPLRAVDLAFRALSRWTPSMVAGLDLAQRYGGGTDRSFVLMDSAISERDLAEAPHAQNWSDTVELLTVGRIDAEKNPLLLIDALAELDSRYRLTWVGDGPMKSDVIRRAKTLGVDGRLDLRGWMPFGPPLLDLYRRAHVFVHVSLTEGVPRVLYESLACATPVVATDVGGVRAALDHGRAGLVVPPRDADAVVGAVERIANDRHLRELLVHRGLELARDRTCEAQAARAAAFIAQAARPL
jgi:glycosyltransferase involved in cell wall biosynthesis